jgi:hypothetical protein
MRRVIAKNTLSFMTSKSYRFIRTPPGVWEQLKAEFPFTLDACASDKNHLLPKYYTKENSCLDKDWTGEVVYCHPMFDGHIGDFVEKATESRCLTVMLLPASTHTRYFHKYIWDKEKNCPRPNVEIRFLEKPKKGFNFGTEEGSFEIKRGKVGHIQPIMVVVFRNQNPIDSMEVNKDV